MKLDMQKIEEFAKDAGLMDWMTFTKKYGPKPSKFGLGYLSNIHIYYTLKAHARGRIHARKLGKVCTWGTPVKREKSSSQTYPLLGKRYYYEINTLEEQAAFLGEAFLSKFKPTEEAKVA